MYFAKFLSYLFHPLFAPVLSVFILFNFPTYLNYKFPPSYFNAVYGALTINLVLAPLGISLYFKKRGIIKSLEMETAKERVLPYLISSVFYIFTFFLLQKIQFPALYLAVFKGATVVVILLLLFALANQKISAHLAGLGGIVGMIALSGYLLQVDVFALLMTAVIISGMVASSRLMLKAHTFLELAVGFCLGVGMQLAFLA